MTAVTATEARDIALARVERHAGPKWSDAAQDAIRSLPAGLRLTGEGIRAHVSARIGEPHSPNAWGAVVRMAVIRGVLVRTGEWTPMTHPKSHARLTPIYLVSGAGT